MGSDVAFDLEISAVVAVALLVVAVAVVASGGACEGDAAGSMDIESAMGSVTLTTYEQAAKKAAAEERCAICQSEYAKADELVRVVPACGHFFHAECDIDRWLRTRGTCPICRCRLWPPPPGMPLPECPPSLMPPLALPRIPRPECPPSLPMLPLALPMMPRPECPAATSGA